MASIGSKIEASTIADFYTRLNYLRHLNGGATNVSFVAPNVGSSTLPAAIQNVRDEVLATKSALTFLATVDISTFTPIIPSTGDLIEVKKTVNPIEWQIGQLENACTAFFSSNRVTNRTLNFSSFNLANTNDCSSFNATNKTANHSTQKGAFHTTVNTTVQSTNKTANHTTQRGTVHTTQRATVHTTQRAANNGTFNISQHNSFCEQKHTDSDPNSVFCTKDRQTFNRTRNGCSNVNTTYFLEKRNHKYGTCSSYFEAFYLNNRLNNNTNHFVTQHTANYATQWTANYAAQWTVNFVTQSSCSAQNTNFCQTQWTTNYVTQCSPQCSSVNAAVKVGNYNANNSADNTTDFTAVTASYAVNHNTFTVSPLN